MALGADSDTRSVSDRINPVWRTAEQFVMSLPPRSLLLDLGCGSGRYARLNQNIVHICTDFSLEQCKLTSSKTDVVRASALNLPFLSASFDHVMCLHMIHHLRTQEQRIRCLAEIYRILRVGGSAFVTARSIAKSKSGEVECEEGGDLGRFFSEGEFFRLADGLPDLECLEEVEIDGRMEGAFLRIG
jgi:ubiquinone/menaquinone biosynthesis C-methylase UbiE